MSSLSEGSLSGAPRVAVLLATHNGEKWLGEQLSSILDQRGVAVRVFARDDESSDSTRELLLETAASDARVTVLPASEASGSAARNFYRLIASAQVLPDEFVAFADQDDVWMSDKLARHARLLGAGNDALSSNVTAFDSRGHRTLVRKNSPQRAFDYLLESPGPGSTFLLSPRLFALVRRVLEEEPALAEQVDFHDGLIYALARSRDWNWLIDDVPTVDYRQHGENVRGANLGLRAGLYRLRLVRSRWHRNQAIALATVGLTVAGDGTRAGLERMLALLTARGIRARWALARQAGQLRRRRRDQWIIALLIATGVW